MRPDSGSQNGRLLLAEEYRPPSPKETQGSDHQDGHKERSYDEYTPKHSSPVLFKLACRLVLLRHQHLILSFLIALHRGERIGLRLAAHTLSAPSPPTERRRIPEMNDRISPARSKVLAIG